MEPKKVQVREEIMFENGITLPKGKVYNVEVVTERGIILFDEAERFMIDLNTFEDGFAAAV